MGQPVLAKTPAYQLEGDGERVLNKKKLDELVRQVCGGTAEGQEGNLLTPEVEEVGFFSLSCQSLLQYAPARNYGILIKPYHAVCTQPGRLVR